MRAIELFLKARISILSIIILNILITPTFAQNLNDLQSLQAPTSSSSIITDSSLKKWLKEQGLNLAKEWDKNYDQWEEVMVELNQLGSLENKKLKKVRISKKSQRLAKSVLKAMRSKINKNNNIPKELKSSIKNYFTFNSIHQRLKNGDQYLGDIPATPLFIIKGENDQLKGIKSYHNLSQSSKAFQIVNPDNEISGHQESIAALQETNSWSMTAKKIFINYLRASSTALGLYNKLQERPPKANNQSSCVKKVEQDDDLFSDDDDDLYDFEIEDLKFQDKDTFKAFDNRRFFRAELDDQRKHDYCWAFAGKRLAEEQASKYDLLKNNATKTYNFSTLDGSQKFWRFNNNTEEGGDPNYVLSNSIENGICQNKYAPYPTDNDELAINNQLNSYGSTITGSTLPKSYQSYQKVNLGHNHSITIDDSLFEAVKNHQLQKVPFLKEDKCVPLGTTLRETLQTLSPQAEVAVLEGLKKSLITSECKLNRHTEPFEKLAAHTDSFFSIFNTTQEKIDAINEATKSGNSVAVGLCANSYINQWGCGGHAIVMNGLRYNSETQNWQGHFVNSWPETDILNGWIDMKDINHNLLQLNYYTKSN